MPTHFFPLTILTQHFEDELFLSEVINFHEISRLHTNAENSIYSARLNAERILKDDDIHSLQKRIVSQNLDVGEINVKILPPKKSLLWREEIELKFHAVFFNREDGFFQVYVPTLAILVLSKNPKDFEETIRREITSALQRKGWTKSLKNLRLLERTTSVSLKREEFAMSLPTTKQRAIAEENLEEKEKSILEEIGDNLNQTNLNPAFEVQEKVELLAEILKGNRHQSVLLVGESGVGKTAIFHELVRQRESLGLGKIAFWATGGARLIAGQSGFGMWQERCQKLLEEAKKLNAVIHLGNLIELFEVGKSSVSSQGIASFLRPKIARGEISIVVECTPEQLPFLERHDPNLLSAFQQIRIEELSPVGCLEVLRKTATAFAELPSEKDRQTEEQAIKTLDSIFRRYSTYTALPAKAVRFLRNLFHQLEQNQPLTSSLVFREFSRESGLPEVILNDEIPLDLNKTELFFKQRIIGQDDAINRIISVLTTIKAKLTRPKKPIASLLFIGPTGVGKTETVKSLAEFFFSDKSRMIRFDMSEFANPLSVQRLIGGSGEKEGILTAKVREQPFSVILLDEFEKAHHSFFDLLLQILGEGRLTDSLGRTADFTNSVIIMTSNLGAGEFQRGKSGFLNNSRERQACVKHFNDAVRAFLRPEIYNRFDQIIPFLPLDKETVEKIARLELEKIQKRDGLRFRKISLNIADEVITHLTQTGYDIRYGARPLKRTIERELLAVLSAELNLFSQEETLTIDVSVKNGKISLDFRKDENLKQSLASNSVLAVQAEKVAELRRRIQNFSTSYKLTELSDEIYQTGRLSLLQKKGKWLSDEDKIHLERKPRIENFLENVRSFAEEVYRLEEEILLEVYDKNNAKNQDFSQAIASRETVFNNFLFELLAFQYLKPNQVSVSFFCENSDEMFRLIKMYLAYIQTFNGKVTRVLTFSSTRRKDEQAEENLLFEREVWRTEFMEKDRFFEKSPENVFGVLLEIEGNLVYPRFQAELGVHNFQYGSRQNRVLLGITEGKFENFKLSDELGKRDSVKFQVERRIYDNAQMKVKDIVLKKVFSSEEKAVQDIFLECNRENLLQIAENLIN